MRKTKCAQTFWAKATFLPLVLSFQKVLVHPFNNPETDLLTRMPLTEKNYLCPNESAHSNLSAVALHSFVSKQASTTRKAGSPLFPVVRLGLEVPLFPEAHREREDRPHLGRVVPWGRQDPDFPATHSFKANRVITSQNLSHVRPRMSGLSDLSAVALHFFVSLQAVSQQLHAKTNMPFGPVAPLGQEVPLFPEVRHDQEVRPRSSQVVPWGRQDPDFPAEPPYQSQ